MINSTINTKDLITSLKKLPLNIQKNVMVGATRAGANVIRDDARSRVRKKTGRLKKSIGLIKRKSKRTEVIFTVSPRIGGRNDGFYGRFLEFGTSKLAPVPFMRPALDNQSDESLKASKEYMQKRLAKEVLKAKR